MTQKVLQIVESLHRCSVERWLLRVWREARDMGLPFDWTMYCTHTVQGELESEAVVEGLRVIRFPIQLRQKRLFLSALRNHVSREGYRIVHSQHDLLSAVYWLGLAGLPGARITHVHNTDESIPTPVRWKHRLLLEPMRQMCLRGSDRILATSTHALDQFLGGRPRNQVEHIVQYCSLDVEDYLSTPREREAVRLELGIPVESEILLFAGRMCDLKNPKFVVDVLRSVRNSYPNAFAVFVGGGIEESSVMRAAVEADLLKNVRVLGWREDVPRLMRAADVLVNPRREHPVEGFGLVVLEAQAVRLPVLISDGISTEAVLSGSVWRQISLRAGADAWANATALLLATPTLDDQVIRRLFAASPFAPRQAVLNLHRIYDEICPGR